MTQSEQIEKLITANGGMIQTSQITDVGISKTALYQYVKANDMEQISHGVYATKNTWTDVMYLVHLRCKQAVFSHETALFLHDLTDREPRYQGGFIWDYSDQSIYKKNRYGEWFLAYGGDFMERPCKN